MIHLMSAPGWYPNPDGSNSVRHWDGQAWGQIAPQQPTPQPPKKGRGKTVALVLIGIVAVSVVANMIRGSGDDAEPSGGSAAVSSDNSRAEWDAKVAATNAELQCEEAVAKRLKSPATASFPEPHTTRPFEDGYEVRGVVDSENGFGATVRSVFGCTSVPDGIGRYVVTVTELAGL